MSTNSLIPKLQNESFRRALVDAIKYAEDFGLRAACVTKKDSVAVTQDCVDYQLILQNAVAVVHGNWTFHSIRKGERWYEKKRTTVYLYKENICM